MNVGYRTRNGKRTTLLSDNREKNVCGWSYSARVRPESRRGVQVQQRRDYCASFQAAYSAAKELIKEYAPKWARVLATILQVAITSIALYAFCTLMAAIELGWIL